MVAYSSRFLWIFCICISCIQTIAQEPRLMLPIGHASGLNNARFSPDGRKVVSTSDDGTVKIWDAETGFLLADVQHIENPHHIVFSNDGKCVIIDMMKVLDLKSGLLLADLPDTSIFLTALHISFDNKKILAPLFSDSSVTVKDLKSGRLLFKLTGNNTIILRAAFSHDAKKIVTFGITHIPRIWDGNTGQLLLSLPDEKSEITYAGFSPDDRRIIVVPLQGDIKIYDTDTGKLLQTFTGSTGLLPYSAKFSPDGKMVVVAGFSTTPTIWDAETGVVLDSLTGHFKHSKATYAEFSPNGGKVVTACDDRTAKIWDSRSGKLLVDLRGHSGKIILGIFSEDGTKMLTVFENMVIRIWDIATSTPLCTINDFQREYLTEWSNSENFSNIKFSTDGKKVLVAYGQVAKIWDAETGKLLKNIPGYESTSFEVQFSPDSKRIVTNYVSDKKQLVANTFYVSPIFPVIWDMYSDSAVKLENFEKRLGYARFSPDGKVIATAGLKVQMWDAHSGKLLKFRKKITSVSFVRFSQDGKYMLTDNYIKGHTMIRDVRSGKIVRKLKRTSSYEQGFPQISPDSKTILICPYDDLIQLYDLHTGKLLRSITTHGLVNFARFSSDSKKIMAACNDSTFIWSAETGNVLFSFGHHSSPVKESRLNYSHFSVNEGQVVTIAEDNTIKVLDIITRQPVLTFFDIDSSGYFRQMPGGYYQCSQNAPKLLHYIAENLEVVSFEQLDIKYNRPDLVSRHMRDRDTMRINKYLKAYSKRVQKLGIDTSVFKESYRPPKLDIQNREEIAYIQRSGFLHVKIVASDTIPLINFNLWVNKVPVYGFRGLSIKDRQSRDLNITFTIKLSRGINRIEASVINSNGLESYRKPLYVYYEAGNPG